MDALQEEDQRANKKAIYAGKLKAAKTHEEIKAIVDEEPGRLIGLHNVMRDLREYRNLSTV